MWTPPQPHYCRDNSESFSEIIVSAHHRNPSDAANALLHGHEVVEHLMTTTLVTEILIEMCVVGEGAGLYALFNTEVSRDTLKSCGLTHLDLLYLIPHWLDDLLEDIL